MKNKYYSRNRRVRKAYWTTFVVALSYFRLSWVSKIRGKKYYEKRIKDLNLKNANRVKNAILELEGLFIKVGQLLSILTNFLPEEYHKPLQSLQDQLPSRPYADIEQRILTEFNQPVEALFSDFDQQPLATASIGQAHRAVLKDGTKVIVKVQHLNIEKTAEIDLQIIERLTILAGRFFDIKGIEYAYTQVREMIEDELNFSQEADSMIKIGENLKYFPQLVIPTIQKAYCSERILVSSFCEGVKISDLEQLDKWGVDRSDVAKRLVAIYIQMVLRDGFYHADPHPGNILIQADGTIVLLDFGAVAHVQPSLRKGIPKLVEALTKNDTDAMLEALRRMDFIADTKDASRIAEKLIKGFRHFLEEEVKVEGLDFKNIQNINPFETSLFKLKNEIGVKSIANTVQVPKDYVLLNRTATLLLGICSALDVTLNPLEVLKPHVETLIEEERGDMVNYLFKSLRGTATSTIALPETMLEVLQKTKRGRLEINTNGSNERTKMLFALGQQLIFVLLLVAATILGFWLRSQGDTEMAKYTFIAGGLFFIMAWRAWRKAIKLYKLVD